MIVVSQNAVSRPKMWRYTWIGAVLYVLLHFLVIHFSASGYPSNFLVIALALLKVGFCLWIAKQTPFPTKSRWLLVATGGFLNNIGLQIYVWRSLLFDNHAVLSSTASFLVALASISILLAITLNFNKEEAVAVRLLDAVLCLTLGYLFFVMLFSPAGVGTNVLSTNLLIDVQDGFFLTCLAIRFFASDTVDDRRFSYVFFFYFAASTPLLAVRNRWNALGPSTLWDLALGVLPVLFMLLAFNPPPAWVRNLRPPERLVHMARGGSPVFMSLALALLAIAISRSHFYLGSTCILLGLVTYGLRNAIIHGKLLETESRLLTAQNELEIQASRDGLTGIPNRRLFDETMRREWRTLVQRGGTLTVLMIDIDLFKDLNDVYGHQTGDACLTTVARTIQGMLTRTGDFVGRYGGEEFAVILPGTSFEGTQIVAERLRSGVMELAIAHAKSPHGYVTVSIGAAIGDASSVPDLSFLIRAADEALYRAKRAGRHRVETTDLTALDSLLLRRDAEPES
ncbi:GGDEF domain-containing protein [Terriglobus tenax]|uniref:GGDEF domain-containing protein n=1 Tax=Terriglobus tenax TaxID=1111115 RepID=UPI0021E0F928|nr:GGDEF domain-containing protein [Terriglobus tenax]